MDTNKSTSTGKTKVYPNAKLHALRVISILQVTTGALYLRGDSLHNRHNTDVELSFRQESNFYYLTGVNEPDFHLIFHIEKQKLILVAPLVDPALVVWTGLPPTLEELAKTYDVDEVVFVSDAAKILQDIAPSVLYTLPDVIIPAELGSGFKTDDTSLLKAIHEARTIKDDFEIEQIRRANEISAEAHKAVMLTAKVGTTETELDALFRYECHKRGAKSQAYLPIVAYGKNAATLHYGRNDQPILSESQLILVDAGCEYGLYASDITRTFPVGGKFTKEAANIYSLVLEMQKAAMDAIKPGVHWEDIHRLALGTAVKGLLKLGILKGNEEEIVKAKTVTAFTVHGLGHYLGLDVHDTNGLPEGKSTEVDLKYLRLRRSLVENNVVTVEPGIYFCDFIIDPYLKSDIHQRYIDKATLDRYRPVGGVRIEDDVLVTKNGYENLTKVPKSIVEIEALITQV